MQWFAFQSSLSEYASDPPILDNEGETMMVLRHAQRGMVMIWLSIFVSMGSCLVAAYYRVIYIEPIFAQITGWCERIMTGNLVDKSVKGRGSGSVTRCRSE